MLGNLHYLWRTDDSATLFHRDRRVAWQGYVYCLRPPAPEFDCPRAAAGGRPEGVERTHWMSWRPDRLLAAHSCQ